MPLQHVRRHQRLEATSKTRLRHCCASQKPDKCPSSESVHDLDPSRSGEDVAQATNLGTWCPGMGRVWPRQLEHSPQITRSKKGYAVVSHIQIEGYRIELFAELS